MKTSTFKLYMALNKILSTTNDLRTLLARASQLIAATLGARQVFIFTYIDDEHHISAGTTVHTRFAVQEARLLDEHLQTVSSRYFLVHTLKKDDPIRRLMVSHRLELILPLYIKRQLLGYVCIGERAKGRYTRRDVSLLQTIDEELAVAIQNAQSVHEVRELNANLEQRIAAATNELRASNRQLQKLDEAKDEFISMASHQLRTPLTSIKGYISMLIEGDLGELTREQKRVLNEAFVSSERMVRLIGDFLNVSRLQTGKFVIEKHPVDLALLVQREVDALEANASARGMKFAYKRPKNIPIMAIDENKIQQVIMNFADNAIYYSKENSTITVTLKKVNGFVECTVKDKGIGVPEAEQKDLFNKFFRATNARRARPDGTGVGLFLAQKVVRDHGGSIIFESKEGKGSTFGFRLPLPKK